MENQKGNIIITLLAIIVFLTFNFFIGGYSIQYICEFWVSYIKEHSVIIPFLPCGIAGIFLAPPAVVIAILTWILSYCI